MSKPASVTNQPLTIERMLRTTGLEISGVQKQTLDMLIGLVAQGLIQYEMLEHCQLERRPG